MSKTNQLETTFARGGVLSAILASVLLLGIMLALTFAPIFSDCVQAFAVDSESESQTEFEKATLVYKGTNAVAGVVSLGTYGQQAMPIFPTKEDFELKKADSDEVIDLNSYHIIYINTDTGHYSDYMGSSTPIEPGTYQAKAGIAESDSYTITSQGTEVKFVVAKADLSKTEIETSLLADDVLKVGMSNEEIESILRIRPKPSEGFISVWAPTLKDAGIKITVTTSLTTAGEKELTLVATEDSKYYVAGSSCKVTINITEYPDDWASPDNIADAVLTYTNPEIINGVVSAGDWKSAGIFGYDGFELKSADGEQTYTQRSYHIEYYNEDTQKFFSSLSIPGNYKAYAVAGADSAGGDSAGKRTTNPANVTLVVEKADLGTVENFRLSSSAKVVPGITLEELATEVREVGFTPTPLGITLADLGIRVTTSDDLSTAGAKTLILTATEDSGYYIANTSRTVTINLGKATLTSDMLRIMGKQVENYPNVQANYAYDSFNLSIVSGVTYYPESDYIVSIKQGDKEVGDSYTEVLPIGTYTVTVEPNTNNENCRLEGDPLVFNLTIVKAPVTITGLEQQVKTAITQSEAEAFIRSKIVVAGGGGRFRDTDLTTSEVDIKTISETSQEISFILSVNSTVCTVANDGLVKMIVTITPDTTPSNPSTPVVPDTPSVPVTPTEPDMPEDPNEPENPVEPTEPVEPVEPAEPVEPTEPVDPVEPVEPTEPITPSEPEVPNAPGAEDAPTGWVKNQIGWWYNDGETYPQNSWKSVNGQWYHFNNTGYMNTGWINDNGTWYYCNTAGEGVEGSMATGWKMVNGSWYKLDNSGAMQTGWINDNGIWYYCNKAEDGTEGKMVTGWKQINGTWYNFNNSGAMNIGWVNDHGTWYYCKDSGAMATGWQKVNNTWYYLNPSGAMQTSKWIGNYWLNADGSMAVNTWVDGGRYYVGPDGVWVQNYK